MEQFRTFVLDWLDRRGWSRARLSEAAEISQSLMSKYLSTDPKRQITPSPTSLEKLAPVLDVPYEDLMRWCGFLPGGSGEAPPSGDDIEKDVAARVAEYMAAVRGTPTWAWAPIIKATFDRAIDDITDWGRLLPDAPPEDRVPPSTADEASRRRSIGGPRRRQGRIKPLQSDVALGPLAGVYRTTRRGRDVRLPAAAR